MMKRIVVYGMFLTFFLAGHAFAQIDRGEEVNNLMAGLESSSQVKRVNSAKIITRSGLRDQALYVKVAALLRAGYMREHEELHADEMSWMCKALAASGDQQYRTLLNEIATKSPSMKVRKYAKESLNLIDDYAKKIAIMNSTEAAEPSLSAEQNRLINMLISDDIGLRRDAAKEIVRGRENDEKVFTAAASALSDMSKDPHSSRLQIDTMAWLCKALAASGDKKHIKLLEYVHDNTPSQKLRSYASKALKTLE